jgi:hydroxypyruvate isomerase
MDRRRFLQASALAGGTLLGSSTVPPVAASSVDGSGSSDRSFQLNYAPSPGQFEAHAGPDLTDQIAFAAEQGFAAFEDNTLRDRSVQEQRRVGDALREHDLRMGVFVAHSIQWEEPSLTTGEAGPRRQFLDEIRASVEVAKRVNATWMTVVPGVRDPRLDEGFQTAHLVETLREAARILEPHDLVMVLEPLNTRRDHPGQFLTHTAQAYQICRAVDSPACKILYDVYHQQITEGNLTPNLDRAWDEIAYLQVADHPGRNEPTTGEIDFQHVFGHLHKKGYDGIVGMEHGTAGEGMSGEQALIDAYATVDPAPSSP